MASQNTRLRQFRVGETVKLKWALTNKTEPLFIGRIQDDGYYQLWKNQKSFDQGRPWDHLAAGSHLVA